MGSRTVLPKLVALVRAGSARHQDRRFSVVTSGHRRRTEIPGPMHSPPRPRPAKQYGTGLEPLVPIRLWRFVKLTCTRPLHKAGWALTAAGRQAHGSNWSSAADIAPCRAWKAASRSASGCRCDIAVLLSIRAAVSSSCSAYQAAIRSCSAAIRWVYTDLAQRRADASEGRGELILMGLPAHQHRPTAPLRTGNAQRYPLPGGNSPGRA